MNQNRSPDAGASEKHYYHLPNESRAQIGRLFETQSSFAPQKVRRPNFEIIKNRIEQEATH